MSKKTIALLLSVFLALLLPMAASAKCDYCGRVKKIDAYEAAGSGTGGAIAGAVVGGVLGNQIGGGSGKTVATVAGVAGGAYAGKKIAENHTTRTRYKITVRMDDGHTEHLDQGSAKNIHVGDYVKVSNGKASRL
jgi:outer membrane lipoprotein SlyB